MTWALRGANTESTSKKVQRINALVRESRMSINATRDALGWRWALIRIRGSLAKLPSTTNSKMLTVPRHFAMRKLEHLINRPDERTTANLQAALRSVRELRAFMTKNPDHLEQLAALSTLWNAARGKHEFAFPLDADRRGLVLMLLAPEMNRMDTHNIPKAVCDWLEELGVFTNDRHVDAFARRKADIDPDGDGSDILVIRYDALFSPTEEYISQMRRIVLEVEAREGTSRPSQQKLF